jgi:MFS superfamily sulfate permease-like transporter
VILAGLIQIVLGIAKGGFIAAFFPSSVIKGLLAAIGVIIILRAPLKTQICFDERAKTS